MSDRLELHEKLCSILGSRNVYFQPPELVKMEYPAIVYSRNDINSRFANNTLYKSMVAYTLTLIDKNPDSEYVDKILRLPYCSFDRHYKSDNLNHDTFIIYI